MIITILQIIYLPINEKSNFLSSQFVDELFFGTLFLYLRNGFIHLFNSILRMKAQRKRILFIVEFRCSKTKKKTRLFSFMGPE